MIIGIDMGHSAWDKYPCGAIGYLNESKENRRVGLVLIQKLRDLGHTVIDCSCDSASNVNSQLYAIVNKANSYNLDLFLSLHLNAGGGRGAEIYSYNGNNALADKLINTYCGKTGLVNRGHKKANFYVLRATKAPALLLEMCFVDTKSDADLWNSLSADFIANAICEGLTGRTVSNVSCNTNTSHNVSTNTNVSQRVVKEYSETGTAKVIVNCLNVRDNPSVNSNVVAQYFNGETFTYNYVKIIDNRVWVRYTSYSGHTRWVCVKENGTRYANCY